MKKKLLALTLSASMLMSMAACGGESADDQTPTPKPTTSGTEATPEPTKEGDKTPDATPTEEAPTPTEEPKLDFGGRTVRIGSYYDMTPDPNKDTFNKAFSDRIKFVEDNYNCKIEFINVGDYMSSYVTSVLAGDPSCEMGYMLTYKMLPALIEGGILQPISDLKDSNGESVVDFDKPWYLKSAVEASTYKNKVYGMPLMGADVQYGIFWNKTLFKQYNLPDLYELYENDQWTWDKFKEIALAGNVDLDGDGEYDIHGFNQRENLIWSFMSSNGADAVKKTDAGVELALDSKEAQEALEAYADFMQNVPHLSGWLGDWQSQIWSFRDGQSMMCYEAWWISSGYLNPNADGEGGMQDEWGFVPFPKGPSATGYASYGKEASPWVMLNGIENPEQVAQIMDQIYRIFGDDEEAYTDAVEASFEANARDPYAVEVCLELMPTVKISPLMGFDALNKLLNNEVFGSIEKGENTPQSALEAYQSALDSMMADIQNHDYNKDLMDTYVNPPEEEGEATE